MRFFSVFIAVLGMNSIAQAGNYQKGCMLEMPAISQRALAGTQREDLAAAVLYSPKYLLRTPKAERTYEVYSVLGQLDKKLFNLLISVEVRDCSIVNTTVLD